MRLLLICLLLSTFAAAQGPPTAQYTNVAGGYQWNRGYFKALHLPVGCGYPSLAPSQWTASGAVYIDTCANKLYRYGGGGVWKAVADSGAVSSVTASNGLTKVGNDIQLGGTLTDNVTIAGNSLYDLQGIDLNNFVFETFASAQLATFSGNKELRIATGSSTASLTASTNNTGDYSLIGVRTDSILILPNNGNLKIDTLPTVTTFPRYNIMARDTLTGTVANIPASLVGVGGGVVTSKGLLLGNSTIAAYSCGSGVETFLMTAADSAAGTTITNDAVPGHTIAQQRAVWEADANRATYDWITVEIGLNDLDPTEAASIALARYQRLIDTINAQKKPSAVVIVAAMSPCKQRLVDLFGTSGGATAYAKYLAMNYAIMGGLPGKITGVSARVDKHVEQLSDGIGNLGIVFDCGDHIHENNDARKIIASAYREQLNRLGFLNIRNNIQTNKWLSRTNDDANGQSGFVAFNEVGDAGGMTMSGSSLGTTFNLQNRAFFYGSRGVLIGSNGNRYSGGSDDIIFRTHGYSNSIDALVLDSNSKAFFGGQIRAVNMNTAAFDTTNNKPVTINSSGDLSRSYWPVGTGGGGGGVAQSVITDTLLNYWRMTGNHVTGGVEKFLGSVNNRSLRFRSNNIERLLLDSASGGLFIKSDANSVNDIRLRVSGGQTGSPTSTATFYNDGSIDFRTWNNAVFLAANVAGTSMQVGHSSMDMQLSAGQIYMGANVSMQGGSTLRGSDYSNNKIQLNQNYMRLVAHGQNGVATNAFDFDTNEGWNVSGSNLAVWKNNGTIKAQMSPTGALAIGTTSPAATAVVDLTSTTQGFLPPRMTTTQKNAISSPAEGLMVYDLTLHKLCVYTGSAWETITSL